MCVFLYVDIPTPWTDFLVDNHRGVVQKVLRSDDKRLSDELAAAGDSSRESVLDKWESLVSKREKVCDYFIHCDPVDSIALQFSDAMEELERLAEQAKEDARADVQNRRIERCVTDAHFSVPWEIYPPSVGSGRNSPKKGGVRKLQLARKSTNRDF